MITVKTVTLGMFFPVPFGYLLAQGELSDPFRGAGDHNCGPQIAAPAAAASAGFNHLSFCDDFNSISTIDVKGSGEPGFNWYTNLPLDRIGIKGTDEPGFNWFKKLPVDRGDRSNRGGPDQTLPDAYSVSHSVLGVTSTGQTGAWALTTRDPITGNGQAWNFGYFEARVRFDPPLGPKAIWFPAFWSISTLRTEYLDSEVWPELDFFEAYTQGSNGRPGQGTYSGEFVGTLHHWQFKGADVPINLQNRNNVQKVDTGWSQWHVIACFWARGKVTWYLDGRALMSQEYSATAPPNPLPRIPPGSDADLTGVFDMLDTQTMQVILGSAPGWPMYVDWVRVWER